MQMKFARPLIVIFLFNLFGAPSWARVFHFAKESFAAYFGGTQGQSLLYQTHFSDTSGAAMTIDKSVLTNMGGEFGVLFSGNEVSLRLGAELIKPGTLKGAIGTDASGTTVYDFESNISAVIPKAALELNLRTGDAWRVFLSFGAGTAAISYKNSYTFAAGQTTFPALANFSDEATGTANLYEALLGVETLMNDTTTIALAVGTRTLETSNYKYKYDVTNFSGAHAAGDAVLNADGTDKASDFGGTIISLLFRFYITK